MKQTVSRAKWTMIGLSVIAAGFMILTFLRYYRENLSELSLKMILLPAGLLAGGFLLGDVRIWKQKEFWFLLCFFGWVFFSALCSEPFYGAFEKNGRYLWILAAEILYLFPIGYAYASLGNTGEQIIGVFAWFSVIITVALCVWGLSCSIRGVYYDAVSLGGFGVGIHPEERRMTIFTHPNPTGLVLALSGILALIESHRLKKTLIRILVCLCEGILYAGICLTDSRTSVFAYALGIGCALFVTVFFHRKNQKAVLQWGMSLTAGIACLAVLFLARKPVTSGLNWFTEYNVANAQEASGLSDIDLHDKDSIEETAGGDEVQDKAKITAKLSEAATPKPEIITTARSRKIQTKLGEIFSGREQIWAMTVKCMNREKRSWLIGFSPFGVGLVMGEWMQGFIGFWTTELHNSLIQILASSGIPAVLFLVAFLILLAKKSIRVMTGMITVSEWIRYIPLLFVCLFCIAMQETFFVVYPEIHFANFWFFLSAGYFCRICSTEDMA